MGIAGKGEKNMSSFPVNVKYENTKNVSKNMKEVKSREKRKRRKRVTPSFIIYKFGLSQLCIDSDSF